MRKRLIPKVQQDALSPGQAWLNLGEIAEVEISSEDTTHPIESALLPGRGSGWRAAQPGDQTIRLRFYHPQSLRRIRLDFVEAQTERTQQYLLRWSPDDGQSYREIARQQWNFSPEGSTSETEEHHVELSAVTLLELTITPDISGGDAIATLSQLKLA
ncbi:MAG: carbohydrate-binding protein [Candidatus Thiodiazotropha sp. (ex Dulcina madagascariensis)]|nr:carbohydrate-binding protein [Candidatus Thiodiazotropha sp. (ex Dulcina madagascariensis)]MCU7924852.1 carbohydrate-binding protein [Candidatus Thiodiazotropha sp. (ex Dulcina madagascariensis)]